MQCSFCGRVCWSGTEHGCCAIERAAGAHDCHACRLAESAARRYAERRDREWPTDAQARRRLERHARCNVCGGRLTCWQLESHHVCRG